MMWWQQSLECPQAPLEFDGILGQDRLFEKMILFQDAQRSVWYLEWGTDQV